MRVLQMSFSTQHWDGLLAILACSDGALRQVVQRWPGIAELTVADVMQRLLCLKVKPPSKDAIAFIQLMVLQSSMLPHVVT